MANKPSFSSINGLPIYKSASGAPAYRKTLTCDSCCPPLDSSYTVTFSGLGGSLSTYNGAHTVLFSSGCFWDDDTGSAYNVVMEGKNIGQDGWSVLVTPDTGFLVGGCVKRWCIGTADDTSYNCAPTGTYNDTCIDADDCRDSNCADTTTCSASSGASCIVS